MNDPQDKRAFEHFLESIELRFHDGDADAASKERESHAIDCIQRMYAGVTADLLEHPRTELQLPRLKAWLHPEVVYEWFSPVMPPFVGRRHGREQVYAQVLENFSALENQRPEMRRIIAQGNDVAVFIHESGNFVRGGNPYVVDAVQIFTLRDDLVATFQTFGHMTIENG